MMRRIFVIPIILYFFLACIRLVSAEEGVNNTMIQDLIEEAIKNNPELKALEEKICAFSERPSQARSLDDPRLRLSIMNLPVDTFRFDQEAMTQKQISVMQRFPFPGKLSLKGEIAEKELEIVRDEYTEKKNNIIMQVKVSYQELLFIEKAIEITKENQSLLREFLKIAETKYAVGKGIQQDVLKAQVELSKITNQLIVLEQKRKTAMARLNTLLNRPVHLPFPGTADVRQTRLNLEFEELKDIAEENRPLLIRLRHLIERNQLLYRLAKREYYPDFDLGISYGQRDESLRQDWVDFFSTSITINIPLWYKTKESAKVAQEKANIKMAEQQYNTLRNEVLFQIKDTLAEIKRYEEEIELFRTGLIPQASLSLESAIAGYKVNKVDFLTLLNNLITLYNYKIKYYEAIINHEKRLAELEAIIGKRLS
jgi:outer membrane protein TolC